MKKKHHRISSLRFNPVSHCLFDMDGTLIDSVPLYHEIIGKCCEKRGKVFTQELRDRTLGLTDHAVAATLVKLLKLDDTVEEFENELIEQSRKILSASPFMPGAERLLHHLKDHNIPAVLATNSTERLLRLHVLNRPKFFNLFQHRVTCDHPEVIYGKPFPEIYLFAAGLFPEKPTPDHCLVFDDTDSGCHAGWAAGMQIVMTPAPNVPLESSYKATIVLPSFLDLKPEWFGIAPFKSPNDPWIWTEREDPWG